jgi:hypothetical protein
MVNSCANPSCAKPLHYLREGRIFVFDVTRTSAPGDAKRAHLLEHFWLCGSCSKTMQLEQTGDGIKIVPKPTLRVRHAVKLADGAIAS